MKLGFYYHIVAYKDADGGVFIPAYLGLFVDELAKHVDQLYYFAYTTKNLTLEQNHELKQTNIVLRDLGNKKSFPYTVVFGFHLLKKFRDAAKTCDKILVRAPSPLAPWFYFTYRKITKIHYLMVGDYIEGIKHQHFGLIKQTAINFFTYINEIFQNVAIKHNGCTVNSVPLKVKYDKYNSNVSIVKTTTLTKNDFYFREDTCNNPENIRLLFVGRIEKAKGLDELIAAFKLLRINNYTVTLHLAGWDTANARHYFKLLQDDVVTADFWEYHGLLSGVDLMTIYRNSDIFILPSHHEGFPRVIWEAMANSLPVIATNVGSIPDNIEHGKNAIIVASKNVNDLFKAIIDLISSKVKRQNLIYNANLLVDDCLLDVQVNKILNHINE